MTQVLSTGRPVRFVPAGQDDVPEEKRRAYLVKVPGMYDRSAWQQLVAEKKGIQHSPERIRRAARLSLERIAKRSDDAELIAEFIAALDEAAEIEIAITSLRDQAMYDAAIADAQAAARAKAGADEGEGHSPEAPPMPALDAIKEKTARMVELAPMIEMAEAVLFEHDPVYRLMIGQNRTYHDICATAAAQMFLVGWENMPEGAPEFRRTGAGLVPDDVLCALDPLEQRMIGNKALSLLSPSGRDAKNSDSPSSGRPVATNSTAARNTRTNGRSSATPGRSRRSA